MTRGVTRGESRFQVTLVAPGLLRLSVAALAAGLFPAAGAQESATPVASWSRTSAVDETTGSLAERGAAVFNNWCDACHRNAEQNAPGTRSLEFKYRGELPAALEERTDLTPALIELYVRSGIATMPFYRKTEISDADLAALSAYLTGE